MSFVVSQSPINPLFGTLIIEPKMVNENAVNDDPSINFFLSNYSYLKFKTNHTETFE